MRSNAGTKTLTCPTPTDCGVSVIPMRNVTPASSRDRRTLKEYKVYLLHCCRLGFYIEISVCSLLHYWVCGSLIVRPLQVSRSTHSFELNISHLKPVKSLSFILLNPALHDRTSWGASPGVGWSCVWSDGWEQSTEHHASLALQQERRMASGQVNTDTTNTLTLPPARPVPPTIAASQQDVTLLRSILFCWRLFN